MPHNIMSVCIVRNSLSLSLSLSLSFSLSLSHTHTMYRNLLRSLNPPLPGKPVLNLIPCCLATLYDITQCKRVHMCVPRPYELTNAVWAAACGKNVP